MNRLLAATLVLALVTPMISAAQEGLTIVRAAPPANPASAENFTGTARVGAFFRGDDPARVYGASVVFEAGARTNWHAHALGQTLIVTAGTGLVQLWGEAVQEIRTGDVVVIPPGEKHWHGASPDASMTHVAIVEAPEGALSTEWMEAVSDEQYAAAPASASGAPAGGDDQPSRAQQLMGDIAPDLAGLTDDVLYGQVWADPALSQRDRSLVTVSALIALNRPDQLRSHLGIGRRNGPDAGGGDRGHHPPCLLRGMAERSDGGLGGPRGVPGAVNSRSVCEHAARPRATCITSRERAEMNRIEFTAAATVFLATAGAIPLNAQEPQPYSVGDPLGVRGPDGSLGAISSNVKVYGAIYSAESCSYDPERGVIVVSNRGVPQNVQTNDGWISFINHDGSVHTARWIGGQSPMARTRLTPPLVLNEPFGSDIVGRVLYVVDRDGGTGDDDPTVAVIRRFDMRTGAPAGEIRVEGAPWLNDLEVADDGTIYATQTGDFGSNPDPHTWRVWRIAADGTASVFVQGAPLQAPNGIAFDPGGNVVVANYGNPAVLTFSPAGELLRTEEAAQPGSDGLVIMPDGTKYVSSVRHGGVSRLRPGVPAELIARNIPSAASMCYDAGANQLVIPMNPHNALAFVTLE